MKAPRPRNTFHDGSMHALTSHLVCVCVLSVSRA